MTVLRDTWTYRKVGRDGKTIFPERFVWFLQPVPIEEAAEAAAGELDDEEWGEDVRPPHEGKARVIEVKDGDQWVRFTVRSRLKVEYQAEKV